jgi:hypothetical protein
MGLIPQPDDPLAGIRQGGRRFGVRIIGMVVGIGLIFFQVEVAGGLDDDARKRLCLHLLKVEELGEAACVGSENFEWPVGRPGSLEEEKLAGVALFLIALLKVP